VILPRWVGQGEGAGEVARYLMLALNGSAGEEGDAEALERWYEEVHLPDFKAIDAVKTARRYKIVSGTLPGMDAWPYVAAYEIETDDMTEVSRRLQSDLRPFHPALDRSRSAMLLAVQTCGDE
jgi:hypothetical protein